MCSLWNSRLLELTESRNTDPCQMGIVFLDLNGLKRVNDQEGHIAGDLLLKNGAMILKSTFIDDEIYRVGGDEFLVLILKTDEAEMEQRVEEIKKKSGMFENVSFSAGCSLFTRRQDVRRALSEADARMYEDKRRYYSSTGGSR